MDRHGTVRVYLIRHGERVDEVDRQWEPAGDEFHYDCPLTIDGLRQAHIRASWLKAELQKQEHVDLDVVHSSPFLRTMQTSSAIAVHFGIPVKPTLGLGHCLAQQRARSKGRLLKLLSLRQLEKKCMGLTYVEADTKDDHFRACMDHLVLAAIDNCRKVLVIVTHREVFYGLAECVPTQGEYVKLRVPYCGVVVYECKRSTTSSSDVDWKHVQHNYDELVVSHGRPVP